MPLLVLALPVPAAMHLLVLSVVGPLEPFSEVTLTAGGTSGCKRLLTVYSAKLGAARCMHVLALPTCSCSGAVTSFPLSNHRPDLQYCHSVIFGQQFELLRVCTLCVSAQATAQILYVNTAVVNTRSSYTHAHTKCKPSICTQALSTQYTIRHTPESMAGGGCPAGGSTHAHSTDANSVLSAERGCSWLAPVPLLAAVTKSGLSVQGANTHTHTHDTNMQLSCRSKSHTSPTPSPLHQPFWRAPVRHCLSKQPHVRPFTHTSTFYTTQHKTTAFLEEALVGFGNPSAKNFVLSLSRCPCQTLDSLQAGRLRHSSSLSTALLHTACDDD